MWSLYPRLRQPFTMFSYLNPIPTLPRYSGPYRVGTSEFEIPISELDAKVPCPNPQVETIKFRLYYPTGSDKNEQPVTWLPKPQDRWIAAYASFFGLSERWSRFISYMPSLIKFTTLPAVSNAALLPPQHDTRHPVAVFSHGLGGNFNTYSSICGSLASHGIVCVALEHRDGSAPITFIHSRTADVAATIPYQKQSHSPTSEVLSSRNAQLRVRIWELAQAYTALQKLNEGEMVSNYSAAQSSGSTLAIKDSINLSPGCVTWLGHSFGATSVVQFIKSIYYHTSIPSVSRSPNEDGSDWRSLYDSSANSELFKQITSSTPVALLDLWTMPLRAEAAKWLWEKPLPCYHTDNTEKAVETSPNTLAIISTEFYNWKDLRNRTQALLSSRPVKVLEYLEQLEATDEATDDGSETKQAETFKSVSGELNKFRVTSDAGCNPSSDASISASPSSSRSLSPPSSASSIDPSVNFSPNLTSKPNSPARLFMIPGSAHLSQSDFGVLFPNVARYFMKAQNPEETIDLNVRAILAIIRGQGLPVADKHVGEAKEEDQILHGRVDSERWISIPLID